MDIKFTEIDNGENYTDYNSEKYWEHSDIKNEKKPKKVTYDDILSSLNMVVNKNGVLQYMELNKNNETFYNTDNTDNTNNNNNTKIVEPQLKNSYIYNKYFKDYTDNKPTIEIRRPKTIEEYKSMLLEDKINRIKARNRLSQIKSTKLLFENSGNIKVNYHKLNKMNFNNIPY